MMGLLKPNPEKGVEDEEVYTPEVLPVNVFVISIAKRGRYFCVRFELEIKKYV
jgi:hypothetical protein